MENVSHIPRSSPDAEQGRTLTPTCSFWDKDSKISSLFGASPPGTGNIRRQHGHPQAPRASLLWPSAGLPLPPRLSWETHLTPWRSWLHRAAFRPRS